MTFKTRLSELLQYMACFFALSGQKEEAIAALAKALPLAPELVEWSRQDSDLDPLRDDPAFQALYKDSANSNQHPD